MVWLHLRRLLHRCELGLCLSLLVAVDHNHAEERSDDSSSEKDDNDWNANGPDARWEVLLNWLIRVDEWLLHVRISCDAFQTL